jgi:hypothetical protein
MNTRVEVSSGLLRLDEYLASWAAFQRWLAEHEGATA